MRIHPEVLGLAQQCALRRVGPLLADRGFYLAGGTAIALQLGHRRSVDFDWFSADRLEDPLRLASELRREGIQFRANAVAPGTLHGNSSGVRLSIFAYRYELLARPAWCSQFSCRLAARADLAAMKLAALAQRGAKKDFIDVYALGKGIPLRKMLDFYRRKYVVGDLAHLLYSLAYFEDADRERTPPLLWRTDWASIKKTLRRRLARITDEG